MHPGIHWEKKTTMALSRNFRTTYYKTLGVPVVQHIVDIEASYHALFAESVINVSQLTKLALEVGISPTYRAIAWKVLCGVLPTYKSLWEMAQYERQVMYEDLVDAAMVLQIPCHKEECRPAVAATVDDPQTSLDAETQHAHVLLALYHTYRSDILRCKPLHILQKSDAIAIEEDSAVNGDFMLTHIASLVERVLVDNHADQFWCLVRMVSVLDEAHGLFEPPLTADALYDLSVPDFEQLFVRALDGLRTHASRNG